MRLATVRIPGYVNTMVLTRLHKRRENEPITGSYRPRQNLSKLLSFPSETGRLLQARSCFLLRSILYPHTLFLCSRQIKAMTKALPSLLRLKQYSWMADSSKVQHRLGFQPTYVSSKSLASFLDNPT